MAASDSSRAGAMNAQVLISTTSASSAGAATRQPAWANRASIFSVSTRALGQPSETTDTRNAGFEGTAR